MADRTRITNTANIQGKRIARVLEINDDQLGIAFDDGSYLFIGVDRDRDGHYGFDWEAPIDEENLIKLGVWTAQEIAEWEQREKAKQDTLQAYYKQRRHAEYLKLKDEFEPEKTDG